MHQHNLKIMLEMVASKNENRHQSTL